MAYSYNRLLTIDRTQCGAANQTNSTVLVSASHTTLRTVANGGHISNTTTQSSPAVTMPADLVFSSDQAGASLYPWEFAYYDGTLGVLVAYVMVPTVNGSGSGSNTSFYIVYGNAAVTTAQNTGSFSPQNAWGSQFKCVLHLNSITQLTDATGNGNNGTNNGMADIAGGFITPGAVESTSTSTGKSIRIVNNLNAMVGGTSVWTVSLWFRIGVAGRSNGPILWDGEGGSNLTLFELGGTDDFYFYAERASGSGRYSGTGKLTGIITDQVWEKFDLVKTASGDNGSVYWNGTLYTGGFASGTLGDPANTGGTWLAAYHNGGTNDMFGRLNQFAVRNVAVSADLLKNEYNNQFTPGNIGSAGFLIWGTEGTPVSGGSQHGLPSMGGAGAGGQKGFAVF